MQFSESDSGARRAQVDAQIRALEEKAASDSLAYRARYFNRAGDLAASIGDLERSLRLWGRAIDTYLQVARHRAAAATCRKAIQRVPEVVRARCTLALLSIGRGDTDAAVRQVEDYVRAAQRAGRSALAASQLRLMGRATADPAIRRRVNELLSEIVDDSATSIPDQGERPLDPEERWTVLLAAAHMSPEDIGRS